MVLSKPLPDESELPPLDERLVEPETRYEMLDGELVYVSPAEMPHGDRHSKLIAAVEAHVGPIFNVVDDVLTRTSKRDDFAPDVSVYPVAPDPTTGGRQLMELAFEVVSTESLGHAAKKASKLVARGVRRVFAIDVKRKRMLEWSARSKSWKELPLRGYLKDRVFAAPVEIDSLLRAAKVDDAMARALLIKKNPVLMADRAEQRDQGRAEGKQEGRMEGRVEGQREGLAKGRREGLAKGRREGLAKGRREGLAKGRADLAEGLSRALLAVLGGRGISLNPNDRTRIQQETDTSRLERWLENAGRCSSIVDLLSES